MDEVRILKLLILHLVFCIILTFENIILEIDRSTTEIAIKALILTVVYYAFYRIYWPLVKSIPRELKGIKESIKVYGWKEALLYGRVVDEDPIEVDVMDFDDMEDEENE